MNDFHCRINTCLKGLCVLAAISMPDAVGASQVLNLRFDEGFGDIATDSSPNSLNGILSPGMDPATDWVTGISGLALDFDGINDFVTVADNALLDFGTGDFSISYWVYKRGTSKNLLDNSYGVAKWGSGSHPGTNEWALNIGSLPGGGPWTNHPSFGIEVGTDRYTARSPDEITLNEWHHLVGVRQGQSLRLYIDGVLKAIDSTLPPNTAVNNTSRDLTVATNTLPNNTTLRTDAVFDEIQIYYFALSDDGVDIGESAGGEIEYLYNNPGAIAPEPLSIMYGILLVGLGLLRRRA